MSSRLSSLFRKVQPPANSDGKETKEEGPTEPPPVEPPEEEPRRPLPVMSKRDNNEPENPKTNADSSEDEVFYPEYQAAHNIEVIKKEENEEKPEGLRNRRVSYGRIPVPPQEMTVEDIQEAAKQSRGEGENEDEPRRQVDPRRSSVSVDVFRGFRDPHDKANMPEKNHTVYVEGTNGKFRAMKKKKLLDRINGRNEENEHKDKDEEESIIPYLLKAPGQAFKTQRAYNQLANIIQGFLAGISVMLAIFSFNLAPEVLMKGYQVMSLPIHAAFLIAFSVGFVSAIDRTGVYELDHFTSTDRLKQTLYNGGLFTIVVWFVGLVSTLLCIQLDSQLAFSPNVIPPEGLVETWRIFNLFRAISAAFGFLLLAFKPDSDTLAKELRRAILDELNDTTSDPDRQEIILKAMKLSLN